MNRSVVAGHAVVGLMPAHHAGQPFSLVRDGQVPALPELVLDRHELRPDPFRVGLAPDPEPPVPRCRADVREPQEGERLRVPLTPCCPVAGGVPPEIDKPALAGCELRPDRGAVAPNL